MQAKQYEVCESISSLLVLMPHAIAQLVFVSLLSALLIAGWLWL
jgi:hypothetical protein